MPPKTAVPSKKAVPAKKPAPPRKPAATPKVALPKKPVATQKVALPKKPVPAKTQPPQQQGYIARYTSAAASGVGNFAGAIVGAVGNGVAGAGKGAGASVTNSTRSWGDTVREYGNSIKDATGASGPRGSSASNPLGLAGGKEGAQARMNFKPGSLGKRGSGANPLGL